MNECDEVPDWAADGEVTPPTSSELQNGFTDCTRLRPSLLNWLFSTITCNLKNIYNVLVPATETQSGLTEIATVAEVIAGSDDFRYITPAKLEVVIASLRQMIQDARDADDFLSGAAVIPHPTDDGKVIIRLDLNETDGSADIDLQLNLGVTKIGGVSPDLDGNIDICSVAGAGTYSQQTSVVIYCDSGGLKKGILPAATESIAGLTEVATEAETTAGLDDYRYITPAKLEVVASALRQMISDAQQSDDFLSGVSIAPHPTDGGKLIMSFNMNGVDGSSDIDLPITLGVTKINGVTPDTDGNVDICAAAQSGTYAQQSADVLYCDGSGLKKGVLPTSTTNKTGLVKLASASTAIAGTNNSEAITSAAMKAAFDQWFEDRFGDWNC